MKIPLNNAFSFRNKDNKILFAPPPKKRCRDTNGREHGYMHMCLFIPAAFDLDFYKVDIECFGTVKLQSNPFNRKLLFNYSLFSSPHFSIYNIFLYKRKHTKFQRKGHSL